MLIIWRARRQTASSVLLYMSVYVYGHLLTSTAPTPLANGLTRIGRTAKVDQTEVTRARADRLTTACLRGGIWTDRLVLIRTDWQFSPRWRAARVGWSVMVAVTPCARRCDAMFQRRFAACASDHFRIIFISP